MAKDALHDIKMKQMRVSAAGQKYIDPSATEAGFRRDGWETTRFENEARQNQLMLEKMDKSPQGMPQDLLDFLNDVGPLERKVNKERTSPKVYESLKSEQEQVRKKVEESRMRKRRIMPMVEHSSDGEEAEEDGTATSRTTNFSSTNKEEDNQHLRLSDSELFGFLTQLKDNKVTAKEIVTQHFENNGENLMLVRIMMRMVLLWCRFQEPWFLPLQWIVLCGDPRHQPGYVGCIWCLEPREEVGLSPR